MKNLNIILLVFFGILLYSCAGSEGARYDSNSDKYKRRNGIHLSPPKTKSGPQSGSYYKR